MEQATGNGNERQDQGSCSSQLAGLQPVVVASGPAKRPGASVTISALSRGAVSTCCFLAGDQLSSMRRSVSMDFHMQ